jgi:hypothetical protein
MRTDGRRWGRATSLVLVAWWVVIVGWPAAARADDLTPVFSTNATCTAWARPTPVAPTNLLPIALPIAVPMLPSDPSGQGVQAGPACPAAADTAHEHASAAGSATADGRWSLSTSAHGDSTVWALANTTVGFLTDVQLPESGDLRVRFDDVTGTFNAACCQSMVDAGYMTMISVSSSAGDFTVSCGTGDFRGPETSYTLPDDRCGLTESGEPARLLVGAGAVHLEIFVQAQSAVGGTDADGTSASARIGRVSVEPSAGGAADGATTAAGGESQVAAGSAAAPGGAVRRAAELARTGSPARTLGAAGGALIGVGACARIASRRRARWAVGELAFTSASTGHRSR